MVDRDLVLAKVEILERCLARIESTRHRSHSALEPLDVQDITVVNLQRAIQAMTDVAAHVVAREGIGVPDSLAASFRLLEQASIIDADLSLQMRRMAGFRNVVVHEYRRLDPAILDAIVRDRLGDLRAFARQILLRFGIE
jgi:uncharacterized protein YutE (UPF0331/DUF86 family)